MYVFQQGMQEMQTCFNANEYADTRKVVGLSRHKRFLSYGIPSGPSRRNIVS
jgi:hypothetical protein